MNMESLQCTCLSRSKPVLHFSLPYTRVSRGCWRTDCMCTVALRQQQQMLHAQQIQAQQQAQQLQFQQMQAQQWQYQAQAAQAQQMAQQPAPQAAAQASDPVPAKPQETKDTATDLLRAGAKLARIWHESNRRLFMVVHVLRQSESQFYWPGLVHCGLSKPSSPKAWSLAHRSRSLNTLRSLRHARQPRLWMPHASPPRAKQRRRKR